MAIISLEDKQERKQTMNEQDPRKKQAMFWLEYGEKLANDIRYSAALAAAEKAIALDETNVEAWYLKGTCLAMEAKYNEALAEFEHVLQLDTTYVPGWDGKAWVLGILGEKDEALQAVNKALELDQNYYQAQKRKERIEAME